MIDNSGVVNLVLEEFFKKLEEEPSLDIKISDNLKKILISKKSLNENAIKEAMFDFDKDC